MKTNDCATCKWHDIYWEDTRWDVDGMPVGGRRIHECICPQYMKGEREMQHENYCPEFPLYPAGATEECPNYRKYERGAK